MRTRFPYRAGMGAKFKSAPKPDAVVPFGFLTYVVAVALVRFKIVGVPPTVVGPVPGLGINERLKMSVNSARIFTLTLSLIRKVRPKFNCSCGRRCSR